MKKINYIAFSIAFFFFWCGCNKNETTPKPDYNLKANQLLRQILTDIKKNEPCDCLLEFSKTSIIQNIKMEQPQQLAAIKKDLIEKLELENSNDLDSLEQLSTNFKLDNDILKQFNIKLIKREMLAFKKQDTLFNICPTGVRSISKPIFDKQYKTAIVYFEYPFTCFGGQIVVYNYNDGKWIDKK
jgi:hypothetical protein